MQSPAGSRQALKLERRFTVKVPLLPGSNSIEAICRERGRQIARSDVQHWRVRLADKPKAWVRLGFAGERIRLDDRAIIYGATPYVFDPQTFRGIQARLEEIAALGANVLWLSPINAAADDDFGYAVTDHFDLRRRFGTARSFRALVAEAHRTQRRWRDRAVFRLDAFEESRLRQPGSAELHHRSVRLFGPGFRRGWIPRGCELGSGRTRSRILAAPTSRAQAHRSEYPPARGGISSRSLPRREWVRCGVRLD